MLTFQYDIFNNILFRKMHFSMVKNLADSLFDTKSIVGVDDIIVNVFTNNT